MGYEWARRLRIGGDLGVLRWYVGRVIFNRFFTDISRYFIYLYYI